MKIFLLTTCICLGLTLPLKASNSLPTMTDTLPYYQIPEAPQVYNASTVVARTIDGLGFRYYWATEGLRAEDLAYRTVANARTTGETIDHILGLAEAIANAVHKKPNIRPREVMDMTFEQKREKTLILLKQASDQLRAFNQNDMNEFDVIFERNEQQARFSFWHLLNGQLADALWHTGQIVAFRRASGNPLNPKVNVFRGTLMN